VILVAGGTGTLGRELVGLLARDGSPVRILTRDPARAAGLSAEVAVGDVRDAASLGPAMAGCSAVVSAVHGFLGGRGAGPEAVDDRGNARLVRAAGEAGVGHVVMISVHDAAPHHPMSLHRAKHAAEQHLRGSGLPWTVLRPTAYLETWAAIVGAKVSSGGPALVLGRGENPINFVSARDVATLAARAVTDPALRHQAIDLPGPDNLTMVELARLLGADRVRHVPRAALRVMAVAAAPLRPALARQAIAALVMDTLDMTADSTQLRRRFPDLTWHDAGDFGVRSGDGR
jgi:uncharacterized protein YbjT (DUF2867 family)